MKILLTRNSEHWKEGVEHLLRGGVWLRTYRQRPKSSKQAQASQKKPRPIKAFGELMALDLRSIKQIGELLGLDHLHIDKKLSKKGSMVVVSLYRVWGKKLEELIEFTSGLS